MAGGGNAIRGSRVGAGPMGEAERGEAAPRQNVTYFCSHEHRTMIAFAVEASVPDTWDCPRCGLPASLDCDNPPPAPKIEPYKTHLAYVKERRSDAEAKDILNEATPASAPVASPATSSSDRRGLRARGLDPPPTRSTLRRPSLNSAVDRRHLVRAGHRYVGLPTLYLWTQTPGSVDPHAGHLSGPRCRVHGLRCGRSTRPRKHPARSRPGTGRSGPRN